MAIAFASYKVTQVEIDFKASYLISDNSYVSKYLTKSDEYFTSGDQVTFYIDSENDSFDYTTVENQKILNELND